MSEKTTTVTPPVETPVEVPPVETPAPEMVSKAEFEKVLADMHKYKGQLRDISSASQAEKEQLLRSQENWKELAELKESEANSYRERVEAIQTSLVNKEKYSALKDAAMRAGIRPEAMPDLELVSMDNVQVETTSTGRVNVLGVQGEIERIKLSRPHWFGGKVTTVAGSIPNVNNSNIGVVTPTELNKLSDEARKTGDYTIYTQRLKQYQQQKK